MSSILTRSFICKTRLTNGLARFLGGCIHCASAESSSAWSARLCMCCDAQIEGKHASQFRCVACAAPLSTDDTYCLGCLMAPPPCTNTVAFADYSGIVQHLILKYKFHHQLSIAPLLADALIHTLKHSSLSADIIIPVPQHDSITKQRGYVPIKYVVDCMDIQHARSNIIPRVVSTALVRLHHTNLQVSSKANDRYRQVKGAFAATLDMSNLNVLLIDDVYTTGATLGELARVCLAAGARSVSNLVVARARLLK